MIAITPMKKAPTLAEASPYKSVAEELETLQRQFREVCQSYAQRIEAEIARLRERVVAAGTLAAVREKSAGSAGRGKSVRGASAALPDLRDMLTLLRTLPLKPSEGRRKDMKKIEAVLEDLRVLAKGWG